MKVPTQPFTMARHILAYRDALMDMVRNRTRGVSENATYLGECMQDVADMINRGLPEPLLVDSAREILRKAGMHCHHALAEFGRRRDRNQAGIVGASDRVQKAILALSAAEEACRLAYECGRPQRGSAGEEEREEDLPDDSGEGHIYLTFIEYGDIEYHNYRDMVAGTKAYCKEKGIPYPKGGLEEGQHYDFFENEEEYNNAFGDFDE